MKGLVARDLGMAKSIKGEKRRSSDAEVRFKFRPVHQSLSRNAFM